MSEQHAFDITTRVVVAGGTYDECFKEALRIAESLYEGNEGSMHIVVTETDETLLGDSDGVFCEGCDGHPFPGVRWPTAANDDDSREWVERCDRCERFETDEAARDHLIEVYGGATPYTTGEAIPAGSSTECFFFETA